MPKKNNHLKQAIALYRAAHPGTSYTQALRAITGPGTAPVPHLWIATTVGESDLDVWLSDDTLLSDLADWGGAPDGTRDAIKKLMVEARRQPGQPVIVDDESELTWTPVQGATSMPVDRVWILDAIDSAPRAFASSESLIDAVDGDLPDVCAQAARTPGVPQTWKTMTVTIKGLNTSVSYLYRDADNYKASRQVILPGLLSVAERKQILDARDDGGYFIPSQVGLDDLQGELQQWDAPHELADDDVNPSDHPWHEMDDDQIEVSAQAPNETMTASELAAAFAEVTWDADGTWL